MARAVMPAAGYRRPERLDVSGLIVSAIGTDGTELGPFDFSPAPAHGQVRAEVIRAFVAATGPDGRWRSAATMNTAYRTTLAFLRSLDRLGIVIISLAQFGPEAWWVWRAERDASSRWPGQVNIMRVLLKEVLEVGPLTRRALAQRTHKPRRRLYGSYTVAEFGAIRRRASELVRATEARISANVTALEQHRAGEVSVLQPTVLIGDVPWTRGALLERLVADGRLTFGPQSRRTARDVAALLGTGDLHPTYALFLNRNKILSVMALLVCDRGYNLSTMQSLTVPDLASGIDTDDDDAPVLVAHLDKPRRGRRRHFTNSFTGLHARTLLRAVAITAPARECLAALGHSTDHLLISGSCSGVTNHPTRIFVMDAFTNGGAVHCWDQMADLTTDHGEVLRLHFNRLRLSEQVINRKSRYKSAVAEGRSIPAGVERDVPWAAIKPVADAIAVMENLHSSDLLFSASLFKARITSPDLDPGAPTSTQIRESIDRLITWCNHRAIELGRPNDSIPADPDGGISLRRLRRTLAWFIYRKPSGRVALGIQYGHLHAATTDGYGGRASAGLRDLFPMEEAFAISDTLHQAVDQLQDNPTVSGPAAARYRAAVTEYQHRYQGLTLTPKQAVALMTNSDLQVHDADGQTLACCFDAQKALCRKGTSPTKVATTPDLTACEDRCANIARNGRHIAAIEADVSALQAELAAALTPVPLRHRIELQILRREAIIQAHHDIREQEEPL